MIPPRCMKLSLDSTVFPRIIAGRVDQIPFQLDREGINEREDGERGGGGIIWGTALIRGNTVPEDKLILQILLLPLGIRLPLSGSDSFLTSIMLMGVVIPSKIKTAMRWWCAAMKLNRQLKCQSWIAHVIEDCFSCWSISLQTTIVLKTISWRNIELCNNLF